MQTIHTPVKKVVWKNVEMLSTMAAGVQGIYNMGFCSGETYRIDESLANLFFQQG